MKLTRDNLKKIIKEELEEMMSENEPVHADEMRRLKLQINKLKNDIENVELSPQEVESLKLDLEYALQLLSAAQTKGKSGFDDLLTKGYRP